MSQPGRVESVNVGPKRTVIWEGREVETGIWKTPVTRRVPVRGVNVDGDDQADRRVHGGPDKAVYAYSVEDYAWWSQRLGREMPAGAFGENLTVSGLDLNEALVGERWALDGVTLEVSQPRLPCYKLGIRMGDMTFPDVFESEGRYGVYLRIIDEGDIGAGDEIRVTHRPDHDLTAYGIAHSYPHPEPGMAERILSVLAVPQGWREWAERTLRRASL